MQRLSLLTDYSPWLLLLCAVTGALYAFFLYQKKNVPWGRNINYLLAFLRFVVVTVICILLLAPVLRVIKNYYEEPVVVLAVDNSTSVALEADSTELRTLTDGLKALQQQLAEKATVVVHGLEGEIAGGPDSLRFDQKSTNLHRMLKGIRSVYENRNLAGVVVLTDGIYNEGISPAFSSFNFPIHTVGLGDTIPKKDINLKTLYHNKLAYQGNDFPIVAEIHQRGFDGETVTVRLKKGDNVLQQQEARFEKGEPVKEVKFMTTSDVQGMQHYVVEVVPVEGEFTHENNSKHAYIDIIEGRERVLLVALSPHPDIKAIRSAIERKQNYELDIHVLGTSNKPPDEANYDLVIFHQIPNRYGRGTELLTKYSNASKLFVLGAQSDINRFNQVNKLMKIGVQGNRGDEVTPALNPDFGRFSIEAGNKELLRKLPPVNVPFGAYQLSADASVLLYQRVGNVVTEKPLLAMQSSAAKKTAVFAGDGMWRWRLEEYAATGSHALFDEFITKLVQFLSTKEDKRRFRVYPIKNEFYDTENVVFETEIYNEIYEKLYGQKVSLKITNEAGKERNYSYVNSELSARFEVGGFPEGVYRYAATTTVDGNVLRSTGEFTVRELQLEVLNLTADHALLRHLAQKNQGNFYPVQDMTALKSAFSISDLTRVIHSNEEYLEVIHLWWIALLLIALATVEWGLRKYKGGY